MLMWSLVLLLCIFSAAAAIAADLPRIAGAGSSLRSDPQQNDGHGCFRSRGGRWLSKPPSRPALVKFEGGIRLNSNATGGLAASALGMASWGFFYLYPGCCVSNSKTCFG